MFSCIVGHLIFKLKWDAFIFHRPLLLNKSAFGTSLGTCLCSLWYIIARWWQLRRRWPISGFQLIPLICLIKSNNESYLNPGCIIGEETNYSNSRDPPFVAVLLLASGNTRIFCVLLVIRSTALDTVRWTSHAWIENLWFPWVEEVKVSKPHLSPGRVKDIWWGWDTFYSFHSHRYALMMLHSKWGWELNN